MNREQNKSKTLLRVIKMHDHMVVQEDLDNIRLAGWNGHAIDIFDHGLASDDKDYERFRVEIYPDDGDFEACITERGRTEIEAKRAAIKSF